MITRGAAVCVYEPRGDNGLEGYLLNTEYKIEHVEEPEHPKYIKGYFRIFMDDNSNYFETAGYNVFKRHFKIISWHKWDLHRIVDDIIQSMRRNVLPELHQDPKVIRQHVRLYKEWHDACPISTAILLKEIKTFFKEYYKEEA